MFQCCSLRPVSHVFHEVLGNLVTAQPELRLAELDPADRFLVLACDGIWDVLQEPKKHGERGGIGGGRGLGYVSSVHSRPCKCLMYWLACRRFGDTKLEVQFCLKHGPKLHDGRMYLGGSKRGSCHQICCPLFGFLRKAGSQKEPAPNLVAPPGP